MRIRRKGRRKRSWKKKRIKRESNEVMADGIKIENRPIEGNE